MKEELYLYILMRTDLPSQKAGRACAQASHATSVLEHERKGHKDLKAWKAQTEFGYGTTIVLGANKEEISKIFHSLPPSFECSGWCIDPDYAISISSELVRFIDSDALKSADAKLEEIPNDPDRLILHRPERTCAYILGTKSELAPYLGHLPLYQG
jgi:hypothetical protein